MGYRPSVDDALFRRTVRTLTASDPRLADLVAAHGEPPLWLRPPGFASLVLLILEQQVSLASAAAAYRRLRERVRTVTPETVLACSPEELRADGVSRQKDRYLRALAEAVGGALDLDALAAHDDDTVRAELVALPGIGRWTADVYLLACLGRPDLWPVGDRALQVAVAEALGLPRCPTPSPSRPWASAGAPTAPAPPASSGTATSPAAAGSRRRTRSSGELLPGSPGQPRATGRHNGARVRLHPAPRTPAPPPPPGCARPGQPRPFDDADADAMYALHSDAVSLLR